MSKMSQNAPLPSLKELALTFEMKEKVDHLTHLAQLVCTGAVRSVEAVREGSSLAADELQITKNSVEEFNKLATELIK